MLSAYEYDKYSIYPYQSAVYNQSYFHLKKYRNPLN